MRSHQHPIHDCLFAHPSLGWVYFDTLFAPRSLACSLVNFIAAVAVVRPPSMSISLTTPIDAAQYRFHVHVYSPKDGIRRPTVVDEGNYNFAGKEGGRRKVARGDEVLCTQKRCNL